MIGAADGADDLPGIELAELPHLEPLRQEPGDEPRDARRALALVVGGAPAVAASVETQLAGITKQLGDVQKELRKRPTTSDLQQTAPIKRVVDANKRLGDVNAELTKRVQDLEERIKLLEQR